MRVVLVLLTVAVAAVGVHADPAVAFTVPGGVSDVLTLQPVSGWCDFSFPSPHKGRYLAIEVLSTLKDGDQAAIAEIYLKGADGKRISHEPWTTKYADSEELMRMAGAMKRR